LPVADLAVDPEVDDFYFQSVFAGFPRTGDFHALMRLPENAQRLTVEGHFGHDGDAPEVQIQASSCGQGQQRTRGPVNGCAGVIANAVLRALAQSSSF
jgi:hypothetical protein